MFNANKMSESPETLLGKERCIDSSGLSVSGSASQ